MLCKGQIIKCYTGMYIKIKNHRLMERIKRVDKKQGGYMVFIQEWKKETDLQLQEQWTYGKGTISRGTRRKG
jgi:hypothetical protein